jgi:Arc/MetJ family transcription regulator
MKMTMHIDEALLERVMARYDLETKTDAVHYALRELDRRARLREVLEAGMGMSAAELKDSVYENYDLKSMRVAETPEPYKHE